MSQATTEKVPAAALRFHFGEASTCELAEPAGRGRIPVKIKARSRGPIEHWYWGRVIHDMAGMRLSKKRLPLDYCHREDEVLGALTAFDTGTGDLLAQGFVDTNDPRAGEILRKAKLGVPFEASIFFDRRSVEAERLSDRETATVNGVTIRGPVTIIRKWTLRGVAICPHGYDPKTSTQFSGEEGDVEVRLVGREEVEKTPNVEMDPSLSAFCDGMRLPEAKGQSFPDQEFIAKFGVAMGGEYFGRGLTMEEAMSEHSKYLQEQNTKLTQQLADAGKA